MFGDSLESALNSMASATECCRTHRRHSEALGCMPNRRERPSIPEPVVGDRKHSTGARAVFRRGTRMQRASIPRLVVSVAAWGSTSTAADLRSRLVDSSVG